MKTICIMNLKGGVGKTVTACNMAAILSADHGKRVLLIDADHQGNTSRFFGADQDAVTIRDVLSGQSSHWPKAVQHTAYKGLDIIPADMTLAELDAFLSDAEGVFPQGERWYEAKFSPRRLADPAKTAKQLGCSTDYLLGLTDDLTPPAAVPVQEDAVPAEMVETLLEEVSTSQQEIHPVWLPGKPEKSGSVAARFTFPESGDTCTNLVQLCWYDADVGKYRFAGNGVLIDAECTGWWPVPEKEDNDADDK